VKTVPPTAEELTDVVHALVAENRRLKFELEEAQDRVRAFERSRWQRLHPTNFLRRIRARGRAPEVTRALPGEERPDRVSDAEADGRLARFRDEVLARGTFSDDWFTEKAHRWEPIFRSLEGRSVHILEIGSYEGLSTCYLLWRLPDAAVTCVDTFEGSVEHGPPVDLEAVFNRNVALVDGSRVRKIVGDSRRVLLDLFADGAQFDLVYVDGSHLALDVIVDASLAWRVLKPGGVLVFDDYDWDVMGDDVLLRPGPAIDAFLGLVNGKHELLFQDRQVAVRKSVRPDAPGR
jgi:SAM-dependent methyltransferase